MRQKPFRTIAMLVATLPFLVVALTATFLPEAWQLPPSGEQQQLVRQPNPTVGRVERATVRLTPSPIAAADLAGSVGAIPGRVGAGPAARPFSQDEDLQRRVEAYLGGQTGTYGVAIADLTTNRAALVNPDRSFAAASTYKLLVMYRAHQLIAEGRLSPDQPIEIVEADLTESAAGDVFTVGQSTTVGEALTQMITVSSNAAALALVRTIGGWNEVAAAAAELGMSGTYIQNHEMFATTPTDMLTFLRALANGQLINTELSNRMIDLLAAQEINDRLPAELPGSAVVAHKTGELPGVRNDVGIVFTPNGRYVICVFGEGDEAEAVEVIADISRLAWEEYGGLLSTDSATDSAD